MLSFNSDVYHSAKQIVDPGDRQLAANRSLLLKKLCRFVESILKYSLRSYNRQFLKRTSLSGTIISKFTEILTAYFECENLKKYGLPTVKYMASKLSLPAGYLSDLLKQETGKTALDHIHAALIIEAKNIFMSTDNTVAETAFQLGFENPPYFSRLFKNLLGSRLLNIDTSF